MSDGTLTTEFWRGKRVFLTGHTGFKGSWLTFILKEWGAEVCGYSLAPNTEPSLFSLLNLKEGIEHHIADIRDDKILAQALRNFRPDVAFHLAAQPLVRESYVEPLATYATNVMGTAHFLEACRNIPSLRSVVVITTDKVYENHEWVWPYREADALGGYDPYSSSKACAEIVTSAYRNSFFHGSEAPLIASVRAGNVIGGGDWAMDRLIPDLIRAMTSGRGFEIRNPRSVRPWQHVLDPLFGYLQVGQALAEDRKDCARAFNLGPEESDCVNVEALLQMFSGAFRRKVDWKVVPPKTPLHEARLLKLDCSLAKDVIPWRPRIALRDAIRFTAEWYEAWMDQKNLASLMREQIQTAIHQGGSR